MPETAAIEAVGRCVVDASPRVHSALGSGLLESAYEACLAHEIGKRGLGVERQLVLPLVYDGLRLDAGYRLDLLVEGCVVVEVKAVERLKAQLISYLKLGGYRLGFLLNFHVMSMRDGITRVITTAARKTSRNFAYFAVKAMLLHVAGTPAYAYTGGQPFDAAQPTVVFIHGAQHDHSVWNLQARYCAHHGRGVLALDLPGHGRSGGPALASVEEMAHWVREFLAAAGAQRFSLVGHSMGALIGLEVAAAAPDRVEKLALVGTGYPMPVGEALLAAARDDEALARRMVNAWSHAPAMHLGGNPNPGMWMLGRNDRLMERMAPGVFYNDLAACNAYRGGEAAAAKLTCPTLAILGSRDAMTSLKAGRAFAALIPGARVTVLEGAGHSLMAERPDALLDALIGFLAG